MSAKKKLCVIGAGPSGLCFLKYCSQKLDQFDVVCYEQGEEIGGMWVYTDETGLNKYGEQVYSSVYKNLIVNLPKPLMQLDGLEYPSHLPSFLQHDQVLKYLRTYADKFDLRRFIKFHNKVVKVEPREISDDYWGTKWIVEVQTMRTTLLETVTQEFDAVIVCSGQHSKPFSPTYEGQEDFQGKVIHSHHYRDPAFYENQTVLVVGASISAMDITPDVAQAARKVYISHYKEHQFTRYPENVEMVTGIKRFTKEGAILTDGREINMDVVIMCTGYHYNLPFLSESCGLNVQYKSIRPLYKHLVSINRPTLFLVGIFDIYCFFFNASYQTEYIMSLLEEKISIPSRQEMLKYEDEQMRMRESLGCSGKSLHFMDTLQYDYLKDLTDSCNGKPIPGWFDSLLRFNSDKCGTIPMWIYKQFQYKIVEPDTFEITFDPEKAY